MKSTLRIDAGFEVAVALALVLLILSGMELPIPGRSGSLAVLAIVFFVAGVALWLLSSRAGDRLVGAVAMANAAGGIVVAGWLSVEASHLSPVGSALVIGVANGFFVLAALEVAELRRIGRQHHRGPES